MPSYGSVIARVFTSDAYIPLRNVPVMFYQTADSGMTSLLALRYTNSSGLTEPIMVETPDPYTSLNPGTSVKPFSTLNIHASFPGYRSFSAEGVQVFPNVETIQALPLHPLAADTQSEPPQLSIPFVQNL